MAEGQDRHAWNHTAELLAMMINSNPWRKGRPVRASAINPYRHPEMPGAGGPGIPITADNLHLLAAAFIGKKGRQKKA